MAGALNVRLGGYNYYHGVAEFREYMGDPKVELKAFHIKESIIMMYLATAIFVIFESIGYFLHMVIYNEFFSCRTSVFNTDSFVFQSNLER